MVMQSSNLLERDFIVLKRAADAGLISLESADYLSKMDVYIFRGMITAYRDMEADSDLAKKATKEFMDLLRHNYQMHLIKKGS